VILSVIRDRMTTSQKNGFTRLITNSQPGWR